MKKINLTQQQTTLIDDEDFEELNKHKWYAYKDYSTFYVRRNIKIDGKRKTLLMHTFIMKTPKGMLIDHRDGNGLNNQKYNLRICTNSQNLMNKGKLKNNKSGLKGVYWHKITNKWASQISINLKMKHLGLFNTKEEAYDAYCEACIKNHGEYSHT